MQKHMATKFANVTTDHINTYRTFCEKCGLIKSRARRGVVVKPILTQNVMSRGQVDLIDICNPSQTGIFAAPVRSTGADYKSKLVSSCLFACLLVCLVVGFSQIQGL